MWESGEAERSPFFPTAPVDITWAIHNFAFAYQAKAGLEYRLTENASLDLAYEFLGTTDPSWSFSQTVGSNTTDYTVKEKGFLHPLGRHQLYLDVLTPLKIRRRVRASGSLRSARNFFAVPEP